MTLQQGILALGTTEHSYIEFNLRKDASIKDLLTELAPIINHLSTTGTNAVLGVKPKLWAQIAPQEQVPAVEEFTEPIVGVEGFEMPATQRDIWLWFSAGDRSTVFNMTLDAIKRLSKVATVQSETNGWVYEENRDLTGFQDGTANPSLLDAAEVITVPEGSPGAGSTILLYQLWAHLATWAKESVEDQEESIGRTKQDSVEFSDQQKATDSHVSRNVVEVDGKELDIFRRNSAYGTATDHGTVFVGFTQDQWREHQMLLRMAGLVDGPRDALTKFTKPLSGAWYVIPSVEMLKECLPEVEDD